MTKSIIFSLLPFYFFLFLVVGKSARKPVMCVVAYHQCSKILLKEVCLRWSPIYSFIFFKFDPKLDILLSKYLTYLIITCYFKITWLEKVCTLRREQANRIVDSLFKFLHREYFVAFLAADHLLPLSSLMYFTLFLFPPLLFINKCWVLRSFTAFLILFLFY